MKMNATMSENFRESKVERGSYGFNQTTQLVLDVDFSASAQHTYLDLLKVVLNE